MEEIEQIHIRRKNAIYSKNGLKNGNKLFNSEISHSYNNLLILNSNTISEFNIEESKNIENNKEKISLKRIATFQEIRNSLKLERKHKDSITKMKKYKKIKYGNKFSKNDFFYPLSKSFINEFDENNIIKNIYEELGKNNILDKRKNSFSYLKPRIEDENTLASRSVTLIKKIESNYNNLNKEKNKDPSFIDEREIIGENINYLKEKNKNYEADLFENKNNNNNISFISINLFIKKIAIDNLRAKNSLLYHSFLQQCSIFLAMDIFIEKIINAFYYYKNKNSKEYPELVNLLNIIFLNKYHMIEKNENLITKLKKFYNEVKDGEFLENYQKEDTLNVYYLLYNENDEYDLNVAKYSINRRKNNNHFFLVKNSNSFKIKKNKNFLDKIFYKKNYFYIFDYTEEEIAIQLTCISYKLMCKITIDELLNSNFSKKDNKKRAPNVMKMIQRWDKLTLFIIEDIFSYDDPNKRAEAITKWIQIAEKCRILYNFNDTLVITTCFANYLFKKVRLTWKKVPSSTIKSLNLLRQFCDNDRCYFYIRNAIEIRKGRFYIPYLGILLKEIVNFEEKYSYILSNGNINCCKIENLSIIINQFFDFKNNPFTKKNLTDLSVLDHLSPKNEDQLEMLAYKIEPKLIIFADYGNQKRRTKTDIDFYMNQ